MSEPELSEDAERVRTQIGIALLWAKGAVGAQGMFDLRLAIGSQY